jgi:hypothetical protein
LKKYLFLIFILGVVVAASGCIGSGGTGSGNVINETPKVSGFNQVALDGIGTLIITQGNTESLTLEAEDNVIPHIKTTVKDNRLQISYDNAGTPTTTKPVKLHLTVKNISSIDISGAGKLNANNLSTDNLNLFVNGAAEGNLTNINMNTLVLTISGAGKLSASGNVDTQTITINGAGEFNAPSLLSQSTTITINGAGKGTVNANKTLNAIINGAGQVNFFGNPQITKQINGVGKINHLVH